VPPVYSDWSTYTDWPKPGDPLGSSDLPGSGDAPGLSDLPGSGDAPGLSDLPGSGDAPGLSDLPGSGDAPGLSDLPGSGDAPGLSDLPGSGDAGAGLAVPVPAPAAARAQPVRSEPGDRPESGEQPPTSDAPAASRPSGRDWRFLISPKWLGWHALMIVLVVAMLALGDWQLRRAEAGNALSWAYTFEWPIFAGFVVVFWVKTIRDEFHPPAWPEWTYSQDVELPAGAVAARSERRIDEDEDEDQELAEYNAYLARLTTEVRGHGKWHGLR
jgi:hypothetical protein